MFDHLWRLMFDCRLKAGADPNLMDETGAKPGDVFHDGVSMSQRFEIKKLIRQRYNLMGQFTITACCTVSLTTYLVYNSERDTWSIGKARARL